MDVVEGLDVEREIGRVGEILSEYEKKRGVLITTLHRIQEEHGYLPPEVLQNLSRKLGLPLAEIYSVASFYHQFHFTPRGRKIVRVCMGTACHVRGAPKVLERLQEHFKIDVGETTPDLTMTLETVGCVGCCGLAPVVTINEEVVGELTPKKVDDVIEAIERSNGDGKA